jgi:hypothetical protein
MHAMIRVELPRLRAAALAAAGLILAALPGCSSGTASVSGKVTYQGKPLTTGTVYLAGPDGIQVPGMISSDGTYRISAVLAGTAKIGVTSFKPASAAAWSAKTPVRGRQPAAPVSGWFAIPDKYADPLTSGLHVDLKGGANEHNIELQ